MWETKKTYASGNSSSKTALHWNISVKESKGTAINLIREEIRLQVSMKVFNTIYPQFQIISNCYIAIKTLLLSFKNISKRAKTKLKEKETLKIIIITKILIILKIIIITIKIV